jgi:hypothetical protein
VVDGPVIVELYKVAQVCTGVATVRFAAGVRTGAGRAVGRRREEGRARDLAIDVRENVALVVRAVGVIADEDSAVRSHGNTMGPTKGKTAPGSMVANVEIAKPRVTPVGVRVGVAAGAEADTTSRSGAINDVWSFPTAS